MTAATEGTVPFRGYRTWYQVVTRLPAAGGGLPLLVVHGGPGLPHDYLEDLAKAAGAERAVVFYDQLGCGKSDHPDDPALWVMDTFADELAAVREALGLDRVHLLGHSWGGWLALEYALRRPSGLASLVLASTCASVPAFAAQTRRLKESLPPQVRQVIDRHEAAGTTGDPAYLQAAMAYRARWVSGSIPSPATSRDRSPTSARTCTPRCRGPSGTSPATSGTGMSPAGLASSTCPCWSPPAAMTK
jgi:proline-specific peptidase